MCPFVNKSDKRCSTHWTLRNISQTFSHCADRYSICPVYRNLIQELFNHARHQEAPTAPQLLAAS